MSTPKIILFLLILTALIFAGVELVIGYMYFQKNGKFNLSTMELAHYLSEKTGRMRAKAYIDTVKARLGGEGLEWEEVSGALSDHIFSPEGEELLNELAARYEEEFVKLKTATDKIGAKLIILSIPSTQGKNYKPWADRFFQDLARRHRVTYIDPAARVYDIGYDRLTFEPWNGHFSRYGHYVMADELERVLRPLADYRSAIDAPFKDMAMADAVPDIAQLYDIAPEHPYWVETNKYGFRTHIDFEEDDPRQRIVILGDSIAFGPYVHNDDTFAMMLQRRLPETLVLNAAAAGYSIFHEAQLFEEKAQYAAPDIVILQTSGGNDVYGLMHFKLNEYDRHGVLHDPTELEAAHISAVIEKLKTDKGSE